MIRKIVKIDEAKCNGCGLCIPNCPEGALQIIDGKARMVSDLSCDGLGACLGHCPLGAISIEEREAEAYDERKVMVNIVKAGPATIKAHLKHLADHNEQGYLRDAIDFLTSHNLAVPDYQEQKAGCPGGHGHGHGHGGGDGGGCPGSRAVSFERGPAGPSSQPVGETPSELRQWPVQLALLNPQAPCFQDAHLLVAADCVPFALGGFHRDFLQDKAVVVFCPKLDQTLDAYIEKLTAILTHNTIRSITITRMEVPCCSGTTRIVAEALQRSGLDIPVEEVVVSLKGEILRRH